MVDFHLQGNKWEIEKYRKDKKKGGKEKIYSYFLPEQVLVMDSL